MGQLLNWESETQLTERAASTELLLSTPTKSCGPSPFGFFSFSSFPCGAELAGTKQSSPGLVTSPM